MFFFEPYYRAAPWGSDRLAKLWSRATPKGPIGESWELVEHSSHHSRCLSNDMHLGELWRAGDLGGSAKGPFPFLLKWLDTDGYLSVQVHPDEKACAGLPGAEPKTEAWLVVHAEPGAQMYLGHRDSLVRDDFLAAAQSGAIADELCVLHPKVGDMIMVPAGTLHAIGPGYTLLEIQQPSETTFRVYDWGRMGLDDKPRELHLQEALASVDWKGDSTEGAGIVAGSSLSGPCFSMARLSPGQTVAAGPLRVLAAPLGALTFRLGGDVRELSPGDVAVLENADGDFVLEAGEGVMLSEPAPFQP